MQNAVWLSSIFGPLLVILGLWMLAYGDNVVKVMASFKSTPSAFYLNGVVNLLIGLTIISQYNVWMWNVSVFLTLLGWGNLIRGILVFFIPQLLIKHTMTSHSFIKGVGIVPLVWGLILCWVAFFM